MPPDPVFDAPTSGPASAVGPVDPWASSADDVVAALAVDPAIGLSTAEVQRRAAESGPNALEPERHESVLGMIREAATEPFVLLLFAAGVGAILLGEVRDGVFVLIGLLPIVGADVVTEFRGERALEALRAAAAPTARVRRDGVVAEVPAADVVPGDILLVRTGDVVPADLRLTVAERLLLDRSALTGESVPGSGSVVPDAAGTSLVARHAMAFAGTGVVGGRGEGVVTAIGAATEVGRIAAGLAGSRGTRHRSPLQAELDRLVRILLVVAIGLIAIVTGLGFLRGQPAGANILAGISAAIAAIPEEPPILLAVILGLGAYRLLKRGVLVRRLNAEETLGAVDLIVTDKTGTLTRNHLEVSSVRTLAGPTQALPERLIILGHAVRAEEDAWAQASGVTPGSFTRALLEALAKGRAPVTLDAAELVEAEPVDDARRYARTVAREPDGTVLTRILGAPEAVLSVASPTTTREAHDRWLDLLEAAASSGERLVGLALARGDAPPTMTALIGFADPIRDGIGAAFATAAEAGIATIVVTGDHPTTAAAIARRAGIHAGRDGDGDATVVLGEELAALSDDDVRRRIPDLRVIARSTPDGKERLVRLAREAGRTVAVTGDGVNDAPALQRADVAVAMGSGTAVAKGASDLVLGDDSFATLMFGLAEGRRIVDNVQKGLVFLVSTHVALLGFILIATLAGFGQPLLPLQILWLELFIDLSTSIAFEREAPEPDLMRRPPRQRGVPLLDNGLLARIVGAGGFSAVAALGIMLAAPGGPEHARWFAYTALVCGQVLRAYANRSLITPIHRLPRNGLLLAAVVLVIAIQVAIPFVPPLAEAFHAVPLSALDWLVVAVIAQVPALVAE
ncbi:MAG: cation-translocating P-type ATPase, partial [Candidatus Limnocylindrales bacterium]